MHACFQNQFGPSGLSARPNRPCLHVCAHRFRPCLQCTWRQFFSLKAHWRMVTQSISLSLSGMRFACYAASVTQSTPLHFLFGVLFFLFLLLLVFLLFSSSIIIFFYRRVPPCAVKTCAVRPVFARVLGELRAADSNNVRGPVKQNASPGDQSEAPRPRWKPGQKQNPGPENQDNQHMLEQPRGYFPDSSAATNAATIASPVVFIDLLS